MLKGPDPKYKIRRAAPIIDRFFMNIILCVIAIIGSATAQKLCIMIVTGNRNRIRRQAPIRALYPRRILTPPNRAITPDSGTAIVASGTP